MWNYIRKVEIKSDQIRSDQTILEDALLHKLFSSIMTTTTKKIDKTKWKEMRDLRNRRLTKSSKAKKKIQKKKKKKKLD